MTATDLMIGDLVRIGDNIGEICSISAANHKYPDLIEYTLVGKFNEWSQTVLLERILPIPLTEEILEKNGIKLDDNSDGSYRIIEGMSFCIDISPDGCFLCAGHDELEDINIYIGVQYVHELQHALKLCGIEKEIIL